MLGLRGWLLPLAVMCAAACGARSSLGESAGGVPPDEGGSPPDGGGGGSKLCPAWVATHAPVQVSNTPSIIQVQSAIALSSGVLVGYADAQLPQVDPVWHARLVSFGDGMLGEQQSLMTRNGSQLGWTRVWLAEGFGRVAATASDETDGMLFVPTDGSGAPAGPVVQTPGDPARYMLATSSGFTVLRSAFDPSGLMKGPVSLAALDPTGAVVSARTLLDAATPVDVYKRIALPDGSFVLVWQATDACPGCRAVHARHFDEGGDAIAPEATVHTFDANSYGSYAVSATAAGFMLAWSENGAAGVQLLAEPFGADGQSLGTPATFAELPSQNAPALVLAEAPGGDLIAAWAPDDTTAGDVWVQSVGADGKAEGAPVSIATVSPSTGEGVLVVASAAGAMVLYESDVPGFGIEVFAIPLRCAS